MPDNPHVRPPIMLYLDERLLASAAPGAGDTTLPSAAGDQGLNGGRRPGLAGGHNAEGTMSGGLQSRYRFAGRAIPRARGGAFWAGILLGPLVLGSGAAFGQAGQPGLSEQTPVDEDAGIRVPEGFDAQVFAEGVGRARHIAVRDNGDVYVALRRPIERSGVAALRDEDGDGAADRIEYFGEHSGTGIAIEGGFFSERRGYDDRAHEADRTHADHWRRPPEDD